jgi:RNA polymerase sigma-70 factor (ECF subfamily)
MNKPLKLAEDQELVRGFIEGNEDCFAVLLERHKNRIFTTIYLIVKDRDVAEDIFQEVMIKVVKMIRAGKYNEEGKFKPWVSRIARNLAIDYFRKVQRTPLVRENNEFDIFNSAAFSEENVEKKIIREENARYIRDLVQQLPEKQKEVLIMRHYGDLSFKEISELTDVSINTALGRMRYALINLRKLMTNDKDESVYERSIRRK